MGIDSYNSQKISCVSFWMIVMVIYIHSHYLESESLTAPNIIQQFCGAIASVAVPMFYAISGFLFFNGISRVEECWPKIKRRARTLLVPYIIWNIIFVFWYVVLEQIPSISEYVNSGILSNISLKNPINMLGFMFVKPAGFHLWFLRDLILFVLCTPLLYCAIKRSKWLTYAIVFLATGWMTRFWMTSFVFGGTLAICYDEGINIFRQKNHRIVLACLVMYISHSALMAFGLISTCNESLNNYLVQGFMIVPIISIWGGYDILTNGEQKASTLYSSLYQYTFFTFLFHEPVFNIVKKIGIKMIGIGDIQLVLLYMINPWIMIFLSFCIGYLFKRVLPKTYHIVTGGR